MACICYLSRKNDVAFRNRPTRRLQPGNFTPLREKQLAGLDPPARAANGYRCYERRHLEQLTFIRSARELGFGLDEIRTLMALNYRKTASCRPADNLVEAHLREIDAKIARLKRLRTVLGKMLATCPGDAVADCSVFDALSWAASGRAGKNRAMVGKIADEKARQA